jgi:hypothetical protein
MKRALTGSYVCIGFKGINVRATDLVFLFYLAQRFFSRQWL